LAKQLTRSSKHDAIALLREDHKKVQKLFKEYQRAKDDAKKRAVVDEVCTDLTVHSQIEEELFYPEVREAIDAMDIMDEAEVEHTLAKQLVQELKAMQPDDPLYGAKFTVLGEYVAHHIEEEQNELFPKVKKAKMDLDSLGEQMAARKRELLAVAEREQQRKGRRTKKKTVA
jgi:hemerythrin superfamily protein